VYKKFPIKGDAGKSQVAYTAVGTYKLANKKPTKQYIKRAYSKDTLRSFVWNTNQATVYPDFSFDTLLSMIDSDPVARGALIHFVDKCMEGGYNIINKEKFSYSRKDEIKLDEKYQFRQEFLRKTFQMLKIYNNVYWEIVRKTNGETKFINVLDSYNIEPITDSNGDTIKFKSRIPNAKTGVYPEWPAKDIVWLKYGDRGQGWAPVDMKAMYETLVAKDYVRRYVAWLWKTGQYRVLYNFKNASDKDVTDFLVFARKHDNNYKTPFVTKGEVETRVLRDIKETENITELMKYYDSQILINMRIPPIDAGIPDATGRSNADAQSNNLSTHITSIKKAIADKINWELFPKINKGNSMLVFSPNDRFAEKSVFENVQIMNSIGMSNEAIEEYLMDKGIAFETKEAFKPQMNPMEMMGNSDNPRNKDMMPSRQKNSVDSGVTSKGTGEQSSTKQSQVGDQ
jgi:hypothetical protein